MSLGFNNIRLTAESSAPSIQAQATFEYAKAQSLASELDEKPATEANARPRLRLIMDSQRAKRLERVWAGKMRCGRGCILKRC